MGLKHPTFHGDMNPPIPAPGISALWFALHELCADGNAIAVKVRAWCWMISANGARHTTPDRVIEAWLDRNVMFPGNFHDRWRARVIANKLVSVI